MFRNRIDRDSLHFLLDFKRTKILDGYAVIILPLFCHDIDQAANHISSFFVGISSFAGKFYGKVFIIHR